MKGEIIIKPIENEVLGDFSNQEDMKTECTRVVIPHHVKRLSRGTFAGYLNLTEIVIPKSVRYVNFDFAVTCEKLSEIKVVKNHSMFISDNGILYDKDMKKLIRCPQGKRGIVTIPEGVETIGQGAFSRCNRLHEIHLPSTLKTIDSGSFALCENLISIEVPQHVETIGQSTFFFCRSLENIILPHAIKKIQANAFSFCQSLVSISIPKTMTYIGKDAFKGCSQLIVYSELETKPQQWSKLWNPMNRPVYWKTKKE